MLFIILLCFYMCNDIWVFKREYYNKYYQLYFYAEPFSPNAIPGDLPTFYDTQFLKLSWTT